MCYPLGSLDFGAIGLEHANARTVSLHLDTDAISLASRCIEDSHVGLVDRHSLFHDTAGGALHGVWLDVLLHQVHAFDHQVRIVLARSNYALLTLVTAGQHDDFVALANLVHSASLENFRCQGHDLHELFSTQFTCHRAKNTSADRLQLCVQQNGSVAIELHQRAV